MSTNTILYYIPNILLGEKNVILCILLTMYFTYKLQYYEFEYSYNQWRIFNFFLWSNHFFNYSSICTEKIVINISLIVYTSNIFGSGITYATAITV